MIDLDGPPPCYACGKPVTVHEWRDGDDFGWWWSCSDRACGMEDNAVVDVRPSYRTFPATAALAAELTELRERLATRARGGSDGDVWRHRNGGTVRRVPKAERACGGYDWRDSDGDEGWCLHLLDAMAMAAGGDRVA